MVELYNDDCSNIITKINHVDLTFTSPPYNMMTRIRNGEYTKRERSGNFSQKYDNFNDDLDIEDYYNFHKACITNMLKISDIILYNIQVVTGSKEALFRLMGDFSKSIKDIIIWDKGHGQPAMSDAVINRATELIIIFEKDATAGRMLKKYNFQRGTMTDILRVKRERSHSKKHKAVFPVELADIIITNFSKENDIIFDPFMGTGTTGVSAIKNNRNFIGIELDPEYFSVAQNRIHNAEKAVKGFDEW
jgi:site-specific DNA-methyltransferase (adenine-specific)/modification methylase